MAVSGFDTSSNWIAGVRVTSKNQGQVNYPLTKTTTGNSTLHADLLPLQDLDDLDVYLAASTAFGAGYYDAARLRRMNKNDKVYAAKMIADPTSFR